MNRLLAAFLMAAPAWVAAAPVLRADTKLAVPLPDLASLSDRDAERLLAAAPVIILLAGGIGWSAHAVLARMHPTVRLAERIAAEEAGNVEGTTIESDAFREGDQTAAALYAEAHAIDNRFKPAGAALGVFLGIALCARLYRLSVLRHEHDYIADKGTCLSCARCFKYCPVEENDGRA